MPPFKIHDVLWRSNTAYATRRATEQEIEQVLLDTATAFQRNLKGRAASHMARGRTTAGRRLTVVFIYRADSRTAMPINAWEDR